MAEKSIKGITIEIGGDVTGLNDALKTTNKQIGATQTQLKDVERLLKLDPTNVTLLEQKQRLLADATEKTSEKLETLKTASEQAAKSAEKYDAWKAAYDPIQSEIDDTKKKLRELRDQQQELADGGGADTDAYKELAEQAKRTAAELKELKQQAEAVNDQFGRPVSRDQYDALQREIIETEQKFQDLNRRAEETEQAIEKIDEDPIEDVENAAKDAGDALGQIGDNAVSFGDILGADMIAEAAGSIVESLGEVAEETKEYRTIMASLKESSEDAGYSASETADLYGKLNGVLADTQAAATTTANLQAIHTEQSKLMEITDGVIGSWAKFGDSIPIDGLSEAVNHTTQLGEVQGVLADVLEWSGISVDEFNTQLGECTTATERADAIAQMFADQGLTAMGQAWQENNENMIESNQSAQNLQEQLARLGEIVEPIFTTATDAAARLLDALNDGLESMAESNAADKLSEDMDDLTVSMSNAAVAAEKNAEEIDSVAYIAQRYVEQLKNLEEAGLNSAEAQEEYANIVELLNELIPDLGLEIESATGLINREEDAVLADIDAWKDRANAHNLQEQLTSELEAQAEAREAVEEAQKRQIELDAEERDLLRKLEAAQEKSREETENATGATNLLIDAMAIGLSGSGDLTGQYEKLADKTLGVTDEMRELETRLGEVRTEQEQLDTEIENANGLIEDSEGRVHEIRDAYDGFATQVTETSEIVEESAVDMSTAIENAAEDIKAAYDAAKEAARDSIDQQIGLFDDLSGKCKLSVEDMIKNLESQQVAFENYADNITLAMERGIDIGFVQKLSDGSAESMQILAKLVTATDEQIEELNTAFAGVERAKDEVADGMAAVSEELLNYLVELGALTKEEAYKLGQQFVNGAVKGIESKKSTYVAAVDDLARSGNTRFEMVQGIESPSKRYRKYAEYQVEGLILGVEDLSGDYDTAMGELAQSGNREYERQSAESFAYAPPLQQAPNNITNTNQATNNFEINVYQQQGEDGEALAHRVLELAQIEVERKGCTL